MDAKSRLLPGFLNLLLKGSSPISSGNRTLAAMLTCYDERADYTALHHKTKVVVVQIRQ